jgi:phage-related protein
MKPKGLRILRDSEGKGHLGCVVSILLFAAAIFVSIKLGPVYYQNFNLESEAKNEVSRAGARYIDDETIVSQLMTIAQKNELTLDRKNIKIYRHANQVTIEINYSVPVDFLVFQHDVSFNISVSSFVAGL